MRLLIATTFALVLAISAGTARAQLDCTAGCTSIKYGFGTDTNFRNSEVPADSFKYNHGDFGPNFGGISYYFNRGDVNFGLNCGAERIFNPLPGQVTLRELTACTPTSEGPKCVGGANAGKSCHLGANAPFSTTECPGSTCQDTAGSGCRVEIPISDGGKTAPASTSEYWITTLNSGAVFDLTAMTGNTLGGSSSPRECVGGPTPRKACTTSADCGTGGTCDACRADFVRQKPSMGTRYLLPADRRAALGLAAGATYIRWDKGLPSPAPGTPPEGDPRIANSTAFRLHQDDAAVCCNSSIAGLCQSANLPFATYPLLWRPSCTAVTGVRTFINEDNILPDWVFEAGRNSRFVTDPNYEVPGEVYGVCLNNRDIGCSRTGNECAALGDTCDLRERGIRIQVAAGAIRDANSDPNPNACGAALAVIRGTPSAGCILQPRYPVDGDPGANCRVFNYGIDARLDANCDGVDDNPVDKCPFLSEWNSAADSDTDCAIAGRCRGDECECGDSNLDGRTTVADIVQTNLMIFGAVTGQLLADSNSDLRTNVSDIVATNVEIFSPDSSTCRHITSIRCGNNVLDSGEACDNGAKCQGGSTPGALCDASGVNTCGTGTCERLGGDGCNPACRVESGWTCTGSPSVCTQ
jgi:hypothetical protein